MERLPPAIAPSTAPVTFAPAAVGALSPSQIFRGRNVFILGSTGFVGKVLLSMLLHRFSDLGRVYVMVRRGSGTTSEARFWSSVVTSPAFDPLRDKYRGGATGEGGKGKGKGSGSGEGSGDDGGDAFHTFLRSKVVVVDGDITEKNLGLSEEVA